jgi:pimeloyl-ACP methyl ester carboxylesterase
MVGTLQVQMQGDHGRAVILIPGLGSGAWVWRDAAKHLRANHKVYVLTLAGFDGVPNPESMHDLMGQADRSLLQLITQKHIRKPVLIGHSLGGTLAIRFASEHADLLSGVIAVDGLPVFPGTENLDAGQRKAAAARMQAQMSAATPAQFRAQQVGYMKYMGVIDPKAAEKYGAMQARSNAKAVAGYMAEDLSTDLRPQLPNIGVPLLEISPYNAPDFHKAAAMSGQPFMTEADKTAYYEKLLQGVPHAKVVSISPSRHFVMLDQPQKFMQAVDRFLATLGNNQ